MRIVLLVFMTLALAGAPAAQFARAQEPTPVAAQGVPAAAQDAPTPVDLRWELFAAPGGQRLAVLWLTPAPGYKTYSHDPGPSGMPTTVEARLGPSGRSLTPLYPPGKPTPDLYEKTVTVNVYADATPVFLPLPADLPADFSLEASVSLLACTEVSCWPMQAQTSFSGRQAPTPAPAEAQPWWPAYQALADPGGPRPDPPAQRLPWRFSPRVPEAELEVHDLMRAVPLALLAGLILNLMPCVLPVVTLKLSGLLALAASRDSRERHHLLRGHNIFFSLGILTYFTLLATVLGMAGLAWGQLFQRPGLILGAAALLLALGLSLFGVLHLPVVDLKFGAREMAGHNPRLQAFLTGFLSTLLATPCSGPFLGGVLAWTLMQPVAVVVTVFVCIGLGMASPFLAMAARPDWVRFLPKPGPWMEHLEKLAGFLLLATCLYFVAILPQAMLVPALAALLATAFACHAWGAWTNLSQPPLLRWGVRSLAMALSLSACLWALGPDSPGKADPWRPFDPERFSQALGRENMLLDFTADWCPTCKALEKTVLGSKAVSQLAARHGVTLVKVDITREDPKAMELLRALGSASIPVAALFPAGGDAARPVVLRDLFTKDQLDNAARQAFGQARQDTHQPAQATP